MTSWLEKPKEEAYLLNPAFCSAILTAVVEGYYSVNNAGLPYPLLYLVLPIILHKPTRELMPNRVNSSLAVWIQENSSVRISFYERVVSLKSFSNEAFLFGAKNNWLGMGPSGTVEVKMNRAEFEKRIKKLGDEPSECVKRSVFLGKWLASAGSAQVVMALWGIKP